MKTEEEVQTCKICYSDDDIDDMISPCMCTGSCSNVHRKCLDKWRSTSTRVYYQCDLCHFFYKIKYIEVSKKKKYVLYMNWLCSLIYWSTFYLILFQILALIIGYILYHIKTHETIFTEMVPTSSNEIIKYVVYGNFGLWFLVGYFSVVIFLIRGENNNVRVSYKDCNSKCMTITFILLGFLLFVYGAVCFIVELSQSISKQVWLHQTTKIEVVENLKNKNDLKGKKSR